MGPRDERARAQTGGGRPAEGQRVEAGLAARHQGRLGPGATCRRPAEWNRPALAPQVARGVAASRAEQAAVR